jgi:hypothetical protein
VVIGAAVVVVVVVVDVVVDVVVVVVVVEPKHTNNELDKRYTLPPLVPAVPCGPTGNNVCDAVGTKPTINDELIAKLEVTDVSANTPEFSGYDFILIMDQVDKFHTDHEMYWRLHYLQAILYFLK